MAERTADPRQNTKLETVKLDAPGHFEVQKRDPRHEQVPFSTTNVPDSIEFLRRLVTRTRREEHETRTRLEERLGNCDARINARSRFESRRNSATDAIREIWECPQPSLQILS